MGRPTYEALVVEGVLPKKAPAASLHRRHLEQTQHLVDRRGRARVRRSMLKLRNAHRQEIAHDVKAPDHENAPQTCTTPGLFQPQPVAF